MKGISNLWIYYPADANSITEPPTELPRSSFGFNDVVADGAFAHQTTNPASALSRRLRCLRAIIDVRAARASRDISLDQDINATGAENSGDPTRSATIH